MSSTPMRGVRRETSLRATPVHLYFNQSGNSWSASQPLRALLRKEAVKNVVTTIEAAQAAGSVRLFSVRHEFPTEWAKFGQTPGANQRFELALNLREEHYPFWSQGRPNNVLRVDLLARSTLDEAPASLGVFDKADRNDATRKTDTLTKDAALDNLLVGRLTGGATGIALPAKREGELKLFFGEKTIGDLWVAVTWGR